MKKLLIFASVISLLVGCDGKNTDEPQGELPGGYKYEGIYIFENGVFSNAHRHEVHFSKEGGEQEILLSADFSDFYTYEKSGISFAILSSCYECDGAYENGETVSRTVWPAAIVAEPSDTERTEIFRVYDTFFFMAAEIIVKQE